MKRKAWLVKRTTADGMIEIRDSVDLGKEYIVDDETTKMINGHNFLACKDWTRLMVKVIDDEAETWFPTELLSFVKEESKDGGMGKDDGKK